MVSEQLVWPPTFFQNLKNKNYFKVVFETICLGRGWGTKHQHPALTSGSRADFLAAYFLLFPFSLFPFSLLLKPFRPAIIPLLSWIQHLPFPL